MEFTKETFNGVFKATLDSLIELPSQFTNSKKLTIYKLIVSKFHYFVYYLLLKQISIDVAFPDTTDLKKLQALLSKVKNGKFEVKVAGEEYEVSLETLSNILIRQDKSALNKLGSLNSDAAFDVVDFFNYFIEKNFSPEDPDFAKFIDELSNHMISLERVKEHLATIKSVFISSEPNRIFHAAQKSRAFATYSAIGESVQKQSISSNAGWQERIQWIIDTFSTWSGSANATHTSGSVASGKSHSEFSPHNILLYGPPGTGKTRASMIIAASILEGSKVDFSPETLGLSKYPSDFANKYKLHFYSTQFHPSYSYEDFFEGLRPVQTLNGEKVEVSYCVVPGIFKAVSQIARAYLEPKEFGIDLMVQFTKDGDKFYWELSDSSTVAHYRLNERPGILQYNGKIVAVTGGLTNPKSEELISNLPETSGLYPVRWFYHGTESNSNFVLFIDELNRGNPAKIFGEALCLIEETKRIGKPEKTEIILPYSHELFAVPPNLHLICAMNSADKSLASLDQAFRRRFRFLYLAPAFDIVTTDIFKQRSEKVFSDDLLESLKNHFVTINNTLKATRVPQENYIGHSYLMKLLRTSYSEEKKMRDAKTPEPERKAALEGIVRKNLRDVWESELHGQIREIVGDNRLQEFCDNFASEVSKIKSNDLFLSISQDISKSLYEYLDNIQPTAGRFPWKSAA